MLQSTNKRTGSKMRKICSGGVTTRQLTLYEMQDFLPGDTNEATHGKRLGVLTTLRRVTETSTEETIDNACKSALSGSDWILASPGTETRSTVNTGDDSSSLPSLTPSPSLSLSTSSVSAFDEYNERYRGWPDRERILLAGFTAVTNHAYGSPQIALSAAIYADRFMAIAPPEQAQKPGWVMGSAILTASSFYLETEELIYISDLTPDLFTFPSLRNGNRKVPIAPKTAKSRVSFFQRRFLVALSYNLLQDTAIDGVYELSADVYYISSESRRRVQNSALTLVLLHQFYTETNPPDYIIALAALIIAHEQFDYPVEGILPICDTVYQHVEHLRQFAKSRTDLKRICRMLVEAST